MEKTVQGEAIKHAMEKLKLGKKKPPGGGAAVLSAEMALINGKGIDFKKLVGSPLENANTVTFKFSQPAAKSKDKAYLSGTSSPASSSSSAKTSSYASYEEGKHPGPNKLAQPKKYSHLHDSNSSLSGESGSGSGSGSSGTHNSATDSEEMKESYLEESEEEEPDYGSSYGSEGTY